MKTVCFLFITILLFISCAKNNEGEIIAQVDLTATRGMRNELTIMQQSLNSLVAGPGPIQRHYWDSAYHYHDSLFWGHHNIYHHNTYIHDDHDHQWVAYDPAVNHLLHYHHPYPGHLNDSLVTTPNNHHHDNSDVHHRGHDLIDHHNLDSLHHLHNLHHP